MISLPITKPKQAASHERQLPVYYFSANAVHANDNPLASKLFSLNLYNFFIKKCRKTLNKFINLLELFKIFPYVAVSIVPKLISLF